MSTSGRSREGEGDEGDRQPHLRRQHWGRGEGGAQELEGGSKHDRSSTKDEEGSGQPQ